MLLTSMFSFSNIIFYFMKDEINLRVTFDLSPANTFNLDNGKILSSSKVLKVAWARVRQPVSRKFLSFSPGVFSPLTSAETCEKSSRWLLKEKLCYYWCEKDRRHICVPDRHDMTLAVKVELNPNTTNQIVFAKICKVECKTTCD